MTTTETYGCDRHGEDAYQGCALCDLEALRKDAERYRFIKRWVRRLDIVGYSLTCNEHFEPRIDEAMEQSHDRPD